MQIIDRKFLNVTTASCHASTTCFYKSKPIYSWFGGSREGNPDVAIYIQCEDKIYSIGENDDIPRWNPILFPYEDQLYLFVKIGIFCDRWNTIIYNISDILEPNFDINKTKCQIIPAGLNLAVKTKPIVLNGLVYCGSSVETIVDWSSYLETHIVKDGIFNYVDRSRPLTVPKKTYDDPYYGPRMTLGIIQMALYHDYKNKHTPLHAFFRSSRGLDRIYHASSYVNSVGRLSWSNPIETKLENPNSGVDCLALSNNRLFLVHNPSSTLRHPLVISELDKELNVIDELVIQKEVSGRTNSKELSYPYLISNDDKLYLTYTYGRSKIETITLKV